MLKDFVLVMIYCFIPLVEVCCQYVCLGDRDGTDRMCAASHDVLMVYTFIVTVTGSVLNEMSYKIWNRSLNTVWAYGIGFICTVTSMNSITGWFGIMGIKYMNFFQSLSCLGYLVVTWAWHYDTKERTD